MELSRQIDGYCERLEPGLWAEPVNAITNLAFVLVALLMWRRTGGQGLGGVLSILLGLIGIASGAFHTHAVVWTAAADSLSILAFTLVYLYGANRRFLGLRRGIALGVTVLFLPYAAAVGAAFAQIPGLGGSAVYLPLPVLIFAYAIGLRQSAPDTARGLTIGALILCASLAFRTVDEPMCHLVPGGTHFVWHLLNAVMLGWMIEVYRRAGSLREA